MNSTLNIGEIEVVVVAQNHNPSILNPDFLLRNKIIEQEWKWETEREPFTTPQLSQVVFKSGILISAEFNRLIFRERHASNIPDKTLVSQIAEKYIKTLPHVTYVAVGINVKGHLLVDSEKESDAFIISGMLKEGEWLKYGSGARTGAVNIVYSVRDAQMNLSVTTALTQQKGEQKPCVMLQGNFHRDLDADHDKSFNKLLSIIADWRNDYAAFLDLVNNYVLKA